MIITIKGADFKDNNIGTLSSYTISRNLGSGATYNGPKFVEKNAALSATITLANGYEFGTVSMTMGGSVISAHTISENVLTIAVGTVTGNVIINVATNWVGVGEEPTPEPDVGGGESGSTDRTYTIGETLKFNDMSEVAATFIEGSYYVSDNGTPAKLSISVRDGYKAWKNIKVYAGQSYALNPDSRAIVIYDKNDLIISAFNLKNTYSDGVIPGSAILSDGWLSCTVTSATNNNTCTITRVA